MTRIQKSTLALSLGTVLLLTACSEKTAEPPKPVAVEQAPTGLKDNFKEAAGEGAGAQQIRSMVDDATIALQGKEYAKAISILEALSGRSDLTPAQRDYVTRTMMSAHKALTEAAAGGSLDAARALEQRRANK